MAHKFLRNREHHKALEARFTPTVPLFPGGNDPGGNVPTDVPTTTPTSDPTPGRGAGGILTSILNPPGIPTTQQQQQPPPIFQTTTSTTIVGGPVVTPVVPTTTTPLATLNTSTPLSPTLSTINPTPVLVQTIPLTSPTPTSIRQVETESTVFTTVIPSSTFSGSSIPAVTPSQAPTSSSLGTGPIVGLAAAGVAGIAVLGVAGIWLFKKYVSHKDEPIDEGNFTRHSWMRNSVALNDDSPDTAAASAGVAGFGATAAGSQHNPNVRPRPPTMIERHQANFTAMRGYTPPPAQQQGPNYNDNVATYGYGYETPGGYDSPYNAASAALPVPLMRTLSPGQTYPTQDINPQPYHNPIASPPPLGHSPAPSNGSNAYASTAANATAPVSYFTRHNSPSSPPPTGPLPNPHIEGSNAGYANMERSTGVTPFQQQTYNEISQQLERSPFADPAIPAPPLSPVRSGTVQVVNVPDVHAGQETPVQFGYNDSQTAQPVATSSHPKRSGSVASKKSTAGRPETMYDEEDAYGGI